MFNFLFLTRLVWFIFDNNLCDDRFKWLTYYQTVFISILTISSPSHKCPSAIILSRTKVMQYKNHWSYCKFTNTFLETPVWTQNTNSLPTKTIWFVVCIRVRHEYNCVTTISIIIRLFYSVRHYYAALY